MMDRKSFICKVLWAKSDPPHPLWCHLIDVGFVASTLWDDCFTKAQKQRLSRCLGIENDLAQTRSWFALLTALHDIGKATPDFQSMNPQMAKRVTDSGIHFPENTKIHHGILSREILHFFLQQKGWGKSEASLIATAVGAHHGSVGQNSPFEIEQGTWKAHHVWKELVFEIIDDVVDALGLDQESLTEQSSKQPVDQFLLAEFAGIVSFVDWMGSASEYFYQQDEEALFTGIVTLKEYALRSKLSAQRSVKECGWRSLPLVRKTATKWEVVFGQNWTPNPLQGKVETLLKKNPTTRFILIEAPMGEGKTEAALFAARHWLQQFQQKGVYLALPTQATSNAMYQRVDEWVMRLFEVGTVESLLVHGGLIHPEYYEQKKYMTKAPKHSTIQEFGESNSTQTVADEWFLNNKRALLAPFGTGTIDQALMGALNAKHWFVRLSGLAGKTVIFDEIHAYDAYTSRLISRLLEYLALLDCTVVLLSATLPASKRLEFFSAFTGKKNIPINPQNQDYPLLIGWPNQDGNAEANCGFETSKRAKKSLLISPLSWNLEEAVHSFILELGESGCGAFLVNTIDEAQKAYRLFDEQYGKELEVVMLFHSRFTASDRSRIEQRVLELFGKNVNRPTGRAVLVATQVVEQSLDLDFDLMASTIAPIDLLLQRSGRLHRHERVRARQHQDPRLLIRLPEGSVEAPDYEKTQYVYDPLILIRTHAVLQRFLVHGNRLEIPGDVTRLIDFVYEQHSEELIPEGWREVMKAAKLERVEEMEKDENFCDSKALHSPNESPRRNLWEAPKVVNDDNQESQKGRSLTRLGDESLSVVILWEKEDAIFFDAAFSKPVRKVEDLLDKSFLRNIMECVVRVPWYLDNPKQTAFEDSLPKGWEKFRVLNELKIFVVRETNSKRSQLSYSSEIGFTKQSTE